MEAREWNPHGYVEHMRDEIPAYDELHQELVAATRDVEASSILDLGTGTGETARRVLDVHPAARLIGIDSSAAMLASAREAFGSAHVQLEVQALQDPLPSGPFDLAVSALAVHHLEGDRKLGLFNRVREVLVPGGRFVLADHIMPDRAEDFVTPADEGYDFPSPVGEQLDWLRFAGFRARLAWQRQDLVVLVADAT